jgi:hypothetical protein
MGCLRAFAWRHQLGSLELLMKNDHKLSPEARQVALVLSNKVVEAIDGWPTSDPRDKPAILGLVIKNLQGVQRDHGWSEGE